MRGTVLSPPQLLASRNDSRISPKLPFLAWLNQMKKFLVARQIALEKWVTIASTYLETNVSQHWDMLALELAADTKDPQLWNNFYDTFLTAYGSVNQELVARNKLRVLKQKKVLLRTMQMSFNSCAHTLLKIMSPGEIRLRDSYQGSRRISARRSWWILRAMVDHGRTSSVSSIMP